MKVISSSYVRKALIDVLATIESRENFVSYEKRYFYLKEVTVNVGTKDNQPAFLYVGLDLNYKSDLLYKLLKRAAKDELCKIEKVFDASEKQKACLYWLSVKKMKPRGCFTRILYQARYRATE